jgi:hypothetical protein
LLKLYCTICHAEVENHHRNSFSRKKFRVLQTFQKKRGRLLEGPVFMHVPDATFAAGDRLITQDQIYIVQKKE